MEALYKIKNDKDLEFLVDKCLEHLSESFNKDFITPEELVGLSIDFIYKIEDLKKELAEIKQDIKENYEHKTIYPEYSRDMNL